MPSYRVTSAGGSVVGTFDADDDQRAEDRGRALARAHRSGSPAGAALTFRVERRSAEGWEVVGSWEVPRARPRSPGPAAD